MKKIAVINDMSGYGKCALTVALPVLSALGCTASPAPTSILSNHTGYSEFYKLDLTEHLADYLQKWLDNGFAFDAVMTGYLGSAEQTGIVEAFLRREKERGAGIFVDPVMADQGKLYCSITPEHIEGMKRLCSVADVISPNLTEACFLAGMDFQQVYTDCQNGCTRHYEEQLNELFSCLHGLGAGCVILTGIEKGNRLINLVSDRRNGLKQFYTIRKNKVGENRHGTGDLFFSVVTGCMQNQVPVEEAVKAAADFVAEAIKVTAGQDPREGVEFEKILGKLTARIS